MTSGEVTLRVPPVPSEVPTASPSDAAADAGGPALDKTSRRGWRGFALATALAGHAVKLACLDAMLSRSLHASIKGFVFNVLLTIGCLALVFACLRGKRFWLAAYYTVHVAMFVIVLCCYVVSDELLSFTSLWSLSGEAAHLPLSTVFALGPLPLLAIVDAPLFVLAMCAAPASAPRSRRGIRRSGGLVLALIAISTADGILPGPATDQQLVLRLHGIVATWLNDLTIPTRIPLSPRPLKHIPDEGAAIIGGGRRPDILLVQVESLDAAALLTEVDGEPVCPYLRRFAADSLYAPLCLSHHYAGNSSDCDFSTLTSGEPHLSIPSMKFAIDEDLPDALPRAVKAKGYSTTAWHDYSSLFFNRRASYRRMGFDRFNDPSSLGLDDEFGADDGPFLRAVARARVDAHDEACPRFDYVITVTSHTPFRFARRFDGLTSNPFPSVTSAKVGDYLRSIRYVDHCLESLLRGLDLSRTIVVIYGDHPPAFPILSESAAVDQRWPTARMRLKDRLAEYVPLIIRSPNLPPRIVRMTACYEDIAPTLIALIGGGPIATIGSPIARADPTGVIPNRGTAIDRRESFEFGLRLIRRNARAPFSLRGGIAETR